MPAEISNDGFVILKEICEEAVVVAGVPRHELKHGLVVLFKMAEHPLAKERAVEHDELIISPVFVAVRAVGRREVQRAVPQRKAPGAVVADCPMLASARTERLVILQQDYERIGSRWLIQDCRISYASVTVKRSPEL